ncbi:methyltransferase domain-containing protein [Actinomadura harenae]|uniref:methyltransferase domain-containing protein n=1 Tax=Actinomadura harenae TaxID=2483351 RepID=UPI001F27C4DC|nr:methyltransferase domain-containing protein [Actinomadura harenae]
MRDVQRIGEAVNAREAVAAVGREPFIPDEIFVRDDAGRLEPLHRSEDPTRWREQVSADAPIVTRVAPDPALPAEVCDPATGKGMVSTSSSSAPFIMARLIEALDVRPGMRVLEIGTGTGYNAAVLAHLVGVEKVVSIEIDPVVASRARAALESAGFRVKVVVGDGELGHAAGAPYDRVIATASAHTVPHAWVEQTRPGGLILVPLAPTVHPEWPLAALKVQEDGMAQGRCVGPSPFMPLRAQHVSLEAVDDAEDRWAAAGKPDVTRYGVTVTHNGQQIWLDSPDNPFTP